MSSRTLSRRRFLAHAAHATALAGAGAATGLAGAGAAAAPRLAASTSTSTSDPDPGAGPDTRVGIAIVGLGNFAQYVLPRLGACRRARIAAFVSGTPDLARRLAAEHDLAPDRICGYAEFERLADARDVAAVYLALPVGLHAEFAERAFALGLHVLTEKTMAGSVAEGRGMVERARAARRTLMVAYRARFDPYTEAAIRLARERELGAPLAIDAHKGFAIGHAYGKDGWRRSRRLAGGGALVDIGIYSVQAARMLAGAEPVEARAIVSAPTEGGGPRGEVEDHLAWMLRFPDGLVATSTASWRYALQNRVRVMCEGGWFELEPATSNGNLRLRIGHGARGERVETRELPRVDQIPLMFDHFAECCATGATPRTPGEEGLADLETIAKIYESARGGG